MMNNSMKPTVPVVETPKTGMWEIGTCQDADGNPLVVLNGKVIAEYHWLKERLTDFEEQAGHKWGSGPFVAQATSEPLDTSVLPYGLFDPKKDDFNAYASFSPPD